MPERTAPSQILIRAVDSLKERFCLEERESCMNEEVMEQEITEKTNNSKPKYFRKVSYLTYEELLLIEKYSSQGLSVKQIAEKMNRSPSTIKVEIAVHTYYGKYSAERSWEYKKEMRNKKGSRGGQLPPSREQLDKVISIINNKGHIKDIRRAFNCGYCSARRLMTLAQKDLMSDEGASTRDKLEVLQQQIDILFDLIKEMKNGKDKEL